MSKTFTFLFLILQALCFSQSNSPSLSIIPQPNKVEFAEGTFAFNSETKIIMGNPSMFSYMEAFMSYTGLYFGYRLHAIPDMQPGENYILLKPVMWEKDSPEKYELTIEKQHITISAQLNGAGFTYAFQSLLQLLSATQPMVSGPETPTITIPCVKITDEPRYTWRGMHLDVSRHFFDVAFIKKYLDLMAFYKMNTFHWHLTDDQGWRIEIKKYPKLLINAAWRNGTMVGKPGDKKYDNLRYGGFYTQENIRDVVNYAAQRNITVVPEIEMPGHSVAAISAYPYLSCTGKQIDVARGWGVFDDVFCTRDSSFKFLEDVLSEVMELFPGKYIHIGGDECVKTRWKKCKYCKQRMKLEHLKNENELQSYFIKRIEKFVNAKGKQIIGWDEILEGGLAPNASVMSWRGTEGGITAARQKHSVVMSPGKPLYFDHYQSLDKDKEPLAIGGYNPMDSVYNYNPTPVVLNNEEQSYIMGAQANVWTEYLKNERDVEYMVFPRMLALSEALWTKPENKNYNSFLVRLQQNKKWLDFRQVNYAQHFLKK